MLFMGERGNASRGWDAKGAEERRGAQRMGRFEGLDVGTLRWGVVIA